MSTKLKGNLPSPGTSCCFDPKNNKLFFGLENGNLCIVDFAQPTLSTKTIVAHSCDIWVCESSPTGDLIATASKDDTIKLWNADSLECVKTLTGHNNQVRGISFSPDGSTLVSSSDDKTVKVWNVSTGDCIQTIKAHDEFVYCCAFSPDGNQFVSGSMDKTLKVWDSKTFQCVAVLKGHTNTIRRVEFVKDYIVSACWDKSLKVWSVKDSFKCVATLSGHIYDVNTVAWVPNGKYLISGSDDKTIRIWETNTWTCTNKIETEKSIHYSSLSKDGSLFAIGDFDSTTFTVFQVSDLQ